MAKVKCKGCGKQVDKNVAYLYEHYTKSGKKQNQWYCNKKEYESIKKEKEMQLECKYITDKLLGYECTNNSRNKFLSELHKKYTYEFIYNYIQDEFNKIDTIMIEKSHDFDNKYNQIAYLFGVINNGITNYEYKPVEDDIREYDVIDEYQGKTNKDKIKKPTLMDIIRKGNKDGR